jgi:F-type H+-transporting ATPase subunit gamma
MAKTREIKKRIKAVGNIRRITKTMQMIATAKFAASEQRAKAGKPYTETIFELVRDLAGSIEDASHPLLDAGGTGAGGPAGPTTKKELTLIITSDRGLCGPYNGSILRAAMAFFKATPSAKEGLVELVGKKGAGFLKFVGVPISKQHAFGDKPSYEQVRSLVDEYIARFTAGELTSVRVVYTKYFSAGKQAPTILQLLPFKADSAAKSGTGGAAAAPKAATSYEFSPDANSLLGDLLPAAVKAVLFQAFNDAIVSEHVARMVAMKAATDNAGKMGKLYSRKFNRARQAQITTELTEIISGAAALE